MRIVRSSIVIASGLLSFNSSFADGYSDWLLEHFTSSEIEASSISGVSSDPDGDGLVNLYEFAFGLLPKSSSASPITTSLSGSAIALTFPERNNLGGASIWIQGSSDLMNWATYNVRPETNRVTGTEFSTVTITDPIPLTGSPPRRFLRLRVDRTPPVFSKALNLSVGFVSPQEMFAAWTDPNTTETGYSVMQFSYTTYQNVAVAALPTDSIYAAGLPVSAQNYYGFFVTAHGPGGTTQSTYTVYPTDSDGDGIPDYLERKGQVIVEGTYDSDPNSYDTDGDGIDDFSELFYYNTNPNSADSDGDGMSDGWEINYGLNPNAAEDAAEDYDLDGLTNLRESQVGTDPYSPDSDYDGLDDYEEVEIYGTEPNNSDTDYDDLNDYEEVMTHLTNPFLPDTDLDGMPDGWEVAYQLDPLSAADASLDPDGDTLSNLIEYQYVTSPRKADTDNDGIRDDEEVALGTNPGYWDTDNDGISDIYEIENELLPLSSSDRNLDPDGDGLTNYQEYLAGTRAKEADSDGDGASDSLERTVGADPNDSSDDGQPPAPEQLVSLKLIAQSAGKTVVGNCAVCHNLSVRVGSELLQNGATINLRRDKAYEIQLIDKLTEWTNAGGGAPHDDNATFTLWPSAVGDQVVTATSDTKQITVTKNGVLEYIIDNNALLLAQDEEWSDSLLEKRATVGLADLDVIHPATGELAEDKEDSGLAGLVAIKRLASTPTTKLMLKKSDQVIISQSQYRLKFNPEGRYAIYSDAARTVPVVSEVTEFSANANTEVYLEGLVKSLSRSAERVTIQVEINNQWYDADSVSLTVVQAEFQVQIKAFIPYAWTEAEDGVMANLAMAGKVAKGDNRGFINLYSDRTTNYSSATFRMMQKVTLTPYPQLHQQPDIQSERLAQAADLSTHYIKATSVDPSEQSLFYGYISPTGTPDKSKEAVLQVEEYDLLTRTPGRSSVEAEAQAEDGAMPWWTLSFSHNIDWKLKIGVSVIDPFNPVISALGKHDRYPAYEIIGINSEGEFEFVHQHSPAADDRPGPDSLRSSNAVDIDKNKVIK